MSEWLDPLLIPKLLTGLLLAGATAWMTVRLSLRRFYSEKWWERKNQAYTDLITALHYRQRYQMATGGSGMDDDELDKRLLGEAAADWDKCSREFDMHCDLASYHLSKEGARIIAEFQRDKSDHWYLADTGPEEWSYFMKDSIATGNCLEALKEESKKDLKIK